MKQKWRLISDLSDHEKEELEVDFNFDLDNAFMIVVLSLEQYGSHKYPRKYEYEVVKQE